MDNYTSLIHLNQVSSQKKKNTKQEKQQQKNWICDV